jgi:aminoacyl-tRNA hydrolase
MKLFNRRKDETKNLIIGLGNHGNRYKNNRHNIGFMVVDLLAEQWGETITKKQARSVLTSHRISGSQVILAKPQTYMNESGRAVKALIDYYKVTPERMIVIFDDLDLPLACAQSKTKFTRRNTHACVWVSVDHQAGWILLNMFYRTSSKMSLRIYEARSIVLWVA